MTVTPCSLEPDIWGAHGITEATDSLEARRLCRTKCPMILACRKAAEKYEAGRGYKNHNYLWGVWGGELPAERVERRKGAPRRRRRTAA